MGRGNVTEGEGRGEGGDRIGKERVTNNKER